MERLVLPVPDARIEQIVSNCEAIATAGQLTHEHVKTLAKDMADLAASHLAIRQLLVGYIRGSNTSTS